MEEFTQTYRKMSDDELIRLHGDIDSLTNHARSALLSEIKCRKLTDDAITERKGEWKRQAEEEIVLRKGRPIQWLKMFGQFGIVVAVAILFDLGLDAASSVNLIQESPRQQELFGQLTADLAILCFAVAFSFLRGRLVGTLLMTTILFAVLTVWIFVLH